MSSPVFILGSHKSGTSLLRNLLDGHPDLFVIPLEAHFFELSGYWVEYAMRSTRPRQLEFEQWVESLAGHIAQSNTQADVTGDSVLTSRWDLDVFQSTLRTTAAEDFATADHARLLERYVDALYASLHHDRAARRPARFVEKSVENAEFAPLLARWFPDARFVHIMRNPYATLVAIRRHSGMGVFPFLKRAVESLRNSYYYAHLNPNVLSNYRVIRYEDLVTNTESVMRTVAEHCNLAWQPGLLRPTVMGEDWGGNSTSGQGFQGLSDRPLHAWKTKIHALEVELINRHFPHVVSEWGYEPVTPVGSPYSRATKERLRDYIRNRAYLMMSQR